MLHKLKPGGFLDILFTHDAWGASDPGGKVYLRGRFVDYQNPT